MAADDGRGSDGGQDGSGGNGLSLERVAEQLAVVRLDPRADVPGWADSGWLSVVTRTPDELSIVCGQAAVPQSIEAWRDFVAYRVPGRLDFSLTGILSRLVEPLAAADVSVFCFSTFDTDYLLVLASAEARALGAWRDAGIDVSVD